MPDRIRQKILLNNETDQKIDPTSVEDTEQDGQGQQPEQSDKELDDVNNEQLEEQPTMKKILIIANFRTGSSFLGDVIQSAPNVFYSYEPLIYFSKEQNKGSKSELLTNILNCQFPISYLKFINGLNGGDDHFMKRNLRGWEACQHDTTLCYQPDFISETCSTFPIQLVKEVRFRVKELAKLLEDDLTTKDWKVVYLVRDPRGTMASRAKSDWCMADRLCRNATVLCKETKDDIKWIKRLQNKNPEHHYLLKFEDFAADVDSEVEKLFNFLDIPVADSVSEFLNNHARIDETPKESELYSDKILEFSITKNSKNVPTAWRSQLSANKIEKINKVCKPVLNLLDYSL